MNKSSVLADTGKRLEDLNSKCVHKQQIFYVVASIRKSKKQQNLFLSIIKVLEFISLYRLNADGIRLFGDCNSNGRVHGLVLLNRLFDLNSVKKEKEREEKSLENTGFSRLFGGE